MPGSASCPLRHRDNGTSRRAIARAASSTPLLVEAEIPPTWECRCGADAKLKDGPAAEVKPVKAPRTHWDMLLERRSIPELEELLEERLTLLRESRGVKTGKKKSA